MFAVPSAADDRIKVGFVLDGRIVTTPSTLSFFDSGLGKTRYGHRPRAVEARLAQAALLARFEPRPDLQVRVQANVDAEHDFGRRVDLVDGFVSYTPAIGDTATLDIRAGLFFPTMSLENTDPGWLSPYTTSFSAINAWIGEEVRNVGVEAGPVFRIGETAETRLRIFGAYTRSNDPNGTLLAWRGFALHDRVSGLADRVPLPPLASFTRPNLFPEQPLHVQPVREVDRKWTWSTGATLDHPSHRLRVLYQPKTADPGIFDGEQYAWRTGYFAIGASRTLGSLELLAQAIDGETRMGVLPNRENAVIARFQSAYGMASWTDPASGRHRLSLRFDWFRVQDEDSFRLEDANDEDGTAWTFAYFYTPNSRHRIGGEVLRVDSTRSNRRDLGVPVRATEVLGTLSWRITF